MADEEGTSSPLDFLPDEVVIEILNKLSGTDRIRSEAVCQRWLTILHDEVWKDTTVLAVSAHSVLTNSCCSKSVKKTAHGKIVPVVLSVIRRCSKWLEHLSFRNLLMNQVDSFFCKNAVEILSLLESAQTLTRFDFAEIVFDIEISKKSTIGKYLQRFCALKSLQTLVFDSNAAFNQAYCHGSPFFSSFLASTVFPILPQLTAFHLEDVNLSSRSLHQLCQHLSPTLIKLCFKLPDCRLSKRALSTSLGLLSNLQELNIGGRRPHTKSVTSLIDDSVIPELFGNLKLLRSLSLRSAVPVTDSGLTELLRLCPFLSSLNIIRCCNVTIRGFSDFLESDLERELVAFVYGTGMTADVEVIGRCSRVKCVADLSLIDESIFWGEKRLECLDDEDARSSRQNAFDVSLIVSSDESNLTSDNFSSDSSDDDLSE